jgi:hypothetical protein
VIGLTNSSTFVLDYKRPIWSRDKAQYLNARQIEAINRGLGSAIANGVDLDICKALFINNASTFTIK